MSTTLRFRIAAAAVMVAAAGLARTVHATAEECRSLVVASAEETPGSSGEKFSAARTTDLTFRLLLERSLTGDHVLELRVFTPRGFLYRSIAVPITLGAAASAPKERRIAGYPRPQRVVAATPGRLGKESVHQIEVAFPVGGTDIAGASLYGRWKVQAFLDAATAPCGKDTTFRITP